MKLSTIVKIAITSSVVLLCTGFALYSFFKLSSAENQKDFNLYTLVPPSASAVFATDDAVKFIAEVDELTCSKKQRYIHLSKLFSNLKKNLHTLFEDTPHGLSRQMNQMLISFHEPDNDHNQVLYCTLSTEDQSLIETFIQKNTSLNYPPKTFNYKGESIVIYPMEDGTFLSCYLTPNFMILSYQKKLIEEVIDVIKSGKSLAADPIFAKGRTAKKSVSNATLFTRFENVIGWTEFDMKLKDDFIYFSGASHDVDTCFTFMNALLQQNAIKGFPGDALPSTAFYFSKQGVTDWPALLSYSEMRGYIKADEGEIVNEWNQKLSRYLIENTESDLMTCLFQRQDTLLGPAAVMSLSVADLGEAERMLRSLIDATSAESGVEHKKHPTFCYTSSKAYPIYALPRTTLFVQLTSFGEPTLHIYASFYKDRLLLAPDADSLSRYIHQLEAEEVLDNAWDYQTGTDGLSDTYHFMLMADFEPIFQQPANYVRIIPDFFIRNADFFRHFILFAQFTCANGVVYPNIVLQYKSD